MKTILFFLLVIVFCFGMDSHLYAQSGCGDSPEAPTAILAFVGSTGAMIGIKVLRFIRR